MLAQYLDLALEMARYEIIDTEPCLLAVKSQVLRVVLGTG